VLARAGLEVVVVERREHVGGATATEELLPGFRFSTCAYALHLLHERVAAEIGLDIDLLEPREATVVLHDGTVAQPDESGAREVGELDGWRAWEHEWDEVARLVDATLLGPPPAWDALARQTRFAELSMNDLLGERFATAEAQTLFARPYFEGDPDEPGGPLAYAYVETSRCRDRRWQGVPRGGMGTVAAEFARAAERAGARRLHGNVGLVEPRRVVLTDGTSIESRVVLVNSAPRDPRPLGPRAAKVHCALRGEPDLSRLGRGRDELGVVHVYGEGGSLVELQLPSLRDDSLAPRGAHTLSIFAPDGRTDALDLAERAIPNLRELIVDVVVHDADALESRIGLTQGQIHHVPHVPAAMYDRRGGARTSVEGVYRCGAAAHPGGEISGIPGWNAAHAVLEDLGA
jgi:phytoene dehydrogenase-like protein